MRVVRAGAVVAVLALGACGGEGELGPPAVATVSVTPPTAIVEVGLTTPLAASPRDASGNTLTNPVTWSSSAATIASVNASGLVTGVAVGSATITAAADGIQGTAAITVVQRPVSSVTMSLNPPTILVGGTSQATVVTRDADGNVLTGRAFTLTIANPSIVTLSSGNILTGVAAGSVIITATSEGKSGAATLTVLPPPVATVSVTLDPASVVAGGNSQAAFEARDEAGNVLAGRVGTWSSSNLAVATISASTGAITANTAGSTSITATVEGTTGTAQLTVTAPGAVGIVTGTVTAADGITPIGDALVEVEGSGGGGGAGTAVASISTRSAPDGSYTLLNVPVGPQVIVASRGAFQAKVNVNVLEGQTVTAPKASLVTQGKLAYVPGVFDAIEDVVSNGLGNAIEEIQVSDLANPAVTSQYRIIFLNCGLDETEVGNAAVIANLKAFMQAGGTIYASDFAGIYVKDLFPTYEFDYVGDIQTITATITDASLQAFTGKTSVMIAYDLPSWTDITTLPTGAVVLLRGSYTSLDAPRTNQPLAFVIPHGSGRLVFTTFHNEAGATQDQIAVLRHFIYLP
ncbi:MAG TPA: Ig-like domain-containing protein [Gemmatimonadaceae bacterium]